MDEDLKLRSEVASLYMRWRFSGKQAVRVSSTMSLAEYISRYSQIASGGLIEDVYVKLIGTTRCDETLLSSDDSSPQLVIFHLHSGDAEVDVVADARKLKMDPVYFWKLYSYMKTGISVGVSGIPGKNERGELYVLAMAHGD